MVLGSTQTLKEINAKNISCRVKKGCQPYHFHVSIVLKSGSSTSWNPQGLSWSVLELLYICLCIEYMSPVILVIEHWLVYRDV
jgi:hypothetical protein